MAGGGDFAEPPVDRFDFPAVRIKSGAAGQGELRHRRHACQCFAAKAHAGDLLKVIQRGDLAGGVAHQRQRQFILGDALAVVTHAQQFDTAAFQLHCNVRRTGVQAVFQQLFQGRSGALDDLSGGDLIDEQVGQQPDGGHGVGAALM